MAPGLTEEDTQQDRHARLDEALLTRSFSRGLLKVADQPVKQVKVIDYNHGVHFLTLSDENKVKIFSLQTERFGPIDIKTLGVIDVFGNSHLKDTWRFPFNNAHVIKEQRVVLAEVLDSVQQAEAGIEEDGEGQEFSSDVVILDTRKQAMDEAQERREQKQAQRKFEQDFIAK